MSLRLKGFLGALLAFVLAASPVAAQYAVPEFGVQTSGATRGLTVRDPSAPSNRAQIGYVNTANHVMTLNPAAVSATGGISGASSTGAFYYGTLPYTETNVLGSFQTNVNSYAQVIYTNTNGGATASTDIVVGNDLGTATTYYGNFGINSSGFVGTGALNKPSATYLTATSGDLAIGTTAANAVHILANSATTDAITVSTANIPQFPVTPQFNTLTGYIKGAGAANATAATTVPTTETTFTQVGAHAVAETGDAAFKARKVSALDYGIKNDGTTNNTTLLNNAITDAAANGCTALYFPAGVYMFSPAGVNLASCVSLEGDAVGGTIFRLNAGMTAAHMFNGTTVTDVTVSNITFDGNAQATTGNFDLLNCTTCVRFIARNNKVIGWDKFGVGINGGSDFRIVDNYIARSSTATSQNQAISVSSSAGLVSRGSISRNVLANSGMDLDVTGADISDNTITNFGFGAGITTEQSVNCAQLVISKNIITGGTGVDVNSYRPGGIENWCPRSTIAGNILYSNSGAGMDQGGMETTVVGNIVFNNGVGTTGVSGIICRYSTATYSCNNSVYSGNRSFDTNGGSGTQAYGFAVQSASNAYITLMGNDFNGNVTGPESLLGGPINEVRPNVTGCTPWTPGAITNGTQVSTNYTIAGARLGSTVVANLNIDQLKITLSAYVDSTNDVRVIASNNTGGSVTLGAATVCSVVELPTGYGNY